MNFGEFVSKKRKEKNLTIRQFAILLDISFTYLSDVENNRSKAFKPEILKKIVSALDLNDNETEELYDLAAQSQNSIPLDIEEYIKNNPSAIVAFRKTIKEEKTKLKRIDALSRENLEVKAYNFLNKYFQNALTEPTILDLENFIENVLNVSIDYQRLDSKQEILGVTVFKTGNLEIYDEQNCKKQILVNKNTWIQ